MNYGVVLAYLRPEAVPNADYFAADDGFKWLGSGKAPTQQECIDAEPAALAALHAKATEEQEADTARADAKQAYSDLQEIIDAGKDPAMVTIATVLQKHILATLGR